MEGIRNACNGKFSNPMGLCNAHIAYKGRSVIVDYEHMLHAYDDIPEGTVPVEVYPYGGDILLFYAKLDKEWSKVDMVNAISIIDAAIADEANVTYEFFNHDED